MVCLPSAMSHLCFFVILQDWLELMPGKYFTKPEPEQGDRVPPGQYLAKGFPVLSYGETPQVSTDEWLLKVWGLVSRTAF